MMEVIEAFGLRMIALMALVAVGWFLMTLAPAIWPAYRARSAGLDRPWLFTAVVAGLIYGLLNAVLLVVAVPAITYSIFIAPQLDAMGQPYGRLFVAGARFVEQYAWVVVPIIQLVATVVLTRKLGRKWPAICSALAA
jgi:hypothetical protein